MTSNFQNGNGSPTFAKRGVLILLAPTMQYGTMIESSTALYQDSWNAPSYLLNAASDQEHFDRQEVEAQGIVRHRTTSLLCAYKRMDAMLYCFSVTQQMALEGCMFQSASATS